MASEEPIRLTTLSHGAGCGCKISPTDLAQLLQYIPRSTDPDLLVGAETSDDAAVYRINAEQAAVFTLDFFTPIVDDPYQFGRIAAANALSDTWAMGGEPRLALNIVAYPARDLPMSLLLEILRGGASIAAEAGVLLAGGHSIDDPEPKYGMAVVGFVHPDRVLRNVGAHPGDILFLTKPLGIGIISTAIKRQQATPAAIEHAIQVMTTLNRGAAHAVQAAGGVHACTDVTGFGLLGHLREMLGGGGIGARLHLSGIPVLEETWELVQAGICPGGTRRNLTAVSTQVDFDSSLNEAQRLVLCDAQTSGGLLIAVAPEKADALAAALRAEGTLASSAIGEIVADPQSRIHVES